MTTPLQSARSGAAIVTKVVTRPTAPQSGPAAADCAVPPDMTSATALAMETDVEIARHRNVARMFTSVA